MQLLNDLFSFLHDGEIALMHFISLEQVFHIYSLLDQDSNLLLIGVGIQLLLWDQLLQLNHFSSRLLWLQFDNQVFKFFNSLNKALSVLCDVFRISPIFLSWHEAHEIFHLTLHFFVFLLNFRNLLWDILIVKDKSLLLFISNPHLLNKVFSGCSLIIISLHPGHPLIWLKQLPFILVNDLLILLSLSL